MEIAASALDFINLTWWYSLQHPGRQVFIVYSTDGNWLPWKVKWTTTGGDWCPSLLSAHNQTSLRSRWSFIIITVFILGVVALSFICSPSRSSDWCASQYKPCYNHGPQQDDKAPQQGTGTKLRHTGARCNYVSTRVGVAAADAADAHLLISCWDPSQKYFVEYIHW